MPAKRVSQKELMRQKGYVTAAYAAKRAGMTVMRVYELMAGGHVKTVTVGQPPKPRRYMLWSSFLAYLGPDGAKALGLT